MTQRPWLSAAVLHSAIAKRSRGYTLRAVYKELNKLDREGIIIKVKNQYALRLAWVDNLISFTDRLSDTYLTPEWLNPVLSGSLNLGPKESLRYSVAYLVGKSYGQQGQMLSVRLQYAF